VCIYNTRKRDRNRVTSGDNGGIEQLIKSRVIKEIYRMVVSREARDNQSRLHPVGDGSADRSDVS
jgi:hypothetical protein